jgi:bifunctional non-homologous end joining protein LigD
MATTIRIPSGAVKRAAPRRCDPCSRLWSMPFPANQTDWVFEVKFDGYRLLARIDSKGVRPDHA